MDNLRFDPQRSLYAVMVTNVGRTGVTPHLRLHSLELLGGNGANAEALEHSISIRKTAQAGPLVK